MSKEQLHEIPLHLDDIQDLFADPEPGSDRYVSGMDYLYSEVRVHHRHEKFKVIIELSQEKITEGLLERTRTKIKRYSQFKAEQSHKELIVLRHQGVDALMTSIVVLVPCVVLGVICTWLTQSGVAGIHGIPEAFFIIIAAACVLGAGWVALWMPAEYFLYDGWSFQNDMRIYKQMADADIVINEHRAEVSGHVGNTGIVHGSSLS